MWEVPALLAGHSARKDLVRLVEFDAAFRAADFFPSWSPDLYSGYGSPIFQFYAPLSYYAAEVPVLMGFDYATAFKLTQITSSLFLGASHVSPRLDGFPGLHGLRRRDILHGRALPAGGHVHPPRSCGTLRLHLAAAHRLGHGTVRLQIQPNRPGHWRTRDRRADLHAQYHGLDWHSCLRRRRLGVRVT